MRHPKRINKYREFRLRLGLTREEVANYIGISISYVEKIENDFKTPGKDKLFKLAKLFKCNVEELYQSN